MWLVVALPWGVGLGLLVLFCVQSYLDGRRFVPGLHGFRWLANMMLGATMFLPALLVAAITIILGRRQLRGRAERLLAAGLTLGSLVIPVLAVWLMPRCFFAGQDAAYRALDCQGIFEACQELRARVLDSGADFIVRKGEPEENQLPPAIRQLSPLGVHATANAVAIQMDGGGPMYHEGIGVLLVGGAHWYADARAPDEVRRLHDSLPVYLYRLYDYRLFLD